MRALLMAGAILVTATSSTPAQRARQFELGAFASYTRYDKTFNLDREFGFGGRLGYLFADWIGIEVDAGFQSPDARTGSATAELLHGSASLVLNLTAGDRHMLYLLGGYSRMDFEETPPYRFTDNAVHGALGHRVFLGGRTALRLEVRGIYAPSTRSSFGTDWAGHVVASAGLSLFTGIAGRDLDRDGVFDRRDACPDTPIGAVVDPRGCPSDADRDAVLNGLDVCPNTPAGAQVDRTGCPLDADRDAVPDGIDQCPATQAGARVDTRGCPADADGDTVPDGPDQCPNTPAGATVDATGCPVDSDRDGVADGLDKCPNTPLGTEVDSVGCQIARDADGDGVDDTKDKCPGTAAGTRVDAAGCPILFESPRTPVVLRGVTFETGRSALTPNSFTVLDIVAASLIANADIRIEIAGHTDNTGSAAVNRRLSQARADAVRAYLASKGVDPLRMVTRGYGPSAPVAPNTTAAGRALNRRVELRQLQ